MAKGINIFIEFYQQNFEVDSSVIYDLSEILVEFQEFVTTRMKSLEEEIKASDQPGNLIRECSRCLQNALILNDGAAKCLFCGQEISLRELAENYSEGSVELCPECNEETMALVLYNNDEGDWICFSCGFKSNYNYYTSCGRCGNVFWNDNGRVVCEDC